MSNLHEIHVAEGNEFIDLMTAADLDIDHINDLQRSAANTVIGLMTVFEGGLGIEPPSGTAIHALMAAMTENSVLADDKQIPDRTSYVPGDQVMYSTIYGKLMTLCRMCKGHLAANLLRRGSLAAPPSLNKTASSAAEDRTEAELKNAGPLAKKLRAEHAGFYNVKLGSSPSEHRATDEQLVKTFHALSLGNVRVSHIKSSKAYGGRSAVDNETNVLSIDKTGALIATDESKSIGRVSSVLIGLNAVIDSLSMAGFAVEIDVKVQTQAGSFGKLADGRQVQFDLQTALALKACYLALVDVLNPKQVVHHFESVFIQAVCSDMAGGHSLSSATMKHISHSAFMAPGDAALSAAGGFTVHPPAAVATAKVASTDTKVADPTEQARLLAKMEKQKTHLERTISDMSAARDRNKVRFNESNSRGGRGDSDRGDRDRSRDSRRSDDRR